MAATRWTAGSEKKLCQVQVTRITTPSPANTNPAAKRQSRLGSDTDFTAACHAEAVGGTDWGGGGVATRAAIGSGSLEISTAGWGAAGGSETAAGIAFTMGGAEAAAAAACADSGKTASASVASVRVTSGRVASGDETSIDAPGGMQLQARQLRAFGQQIAEPGQEPRSLPVAW